MIEDDTLIIQFSIHLSVPRRALLTEDAVLGLRMGEVGTKIGEALMSVLRRNGVCLHSPMDGEICLTLKGGGPQ